MNPSTPSSYEPSIGPSPSTEPIDSMQPVDQTPITNEPIDSMQPTDQIPTASGDKVNIISQRLQNADALVRAAEASGLPLNVACAMIEIESGGKNTYGHDKNGAMYGRDEVTEQNFKNEFLPAINSGKTSNGVGPAQITYKGYFTQNPNYPFWDPYSNMKFGFDILKKTCNNNYSEDGLRKCGSKYNSGSETKQYNGYGKKFADAAARWATKLN